MNKFIVNLSFMRIGAFVFIVFLQFESPSPPLPISLPLTQMLAKRSVNEGLCRDCTTYVMTGHRIPVMSLGRPPVADTLGTFWKKNNCRQTRSCRGSIGTVEPSQDTASGIPNF